jgi:hypothetical protein
MYGWHPTVAENDNAGRAQICMDLLAAEAPHFFEAVVGRAGTGRGLDPRLSAGVVGLLETPQPSLEEYLCAHAFDTL